MIVSPSVPTILPKVIIKTGSETPLLFFDDLGPFSLVNGQTKTNLWNKEHKKYTQNHAIPCYATSGYDYFSNHELQFQPSISCVPLDTGMDDKVENCLSLRKYIFDR